MFRAVIHAREILTGQGVRKKDGRRVTEDDLGVIPDGAIVYRVKKVRGTEIPDRIEWVGPTDQLPKRFSRVQRKDLKRRFSVIPGMVDCHTHLIFAGDRSEEFALRCGGATYEQIAKRGGGILTTVRATRSASIAELERLAIPRLEELAAYGVRTIELKSGYGLSVEAELKILEVISRLRQRFPHLTLTATFLGAHAYPADRDRSEYLREICKVMLPRVAERKLADSCDVFIDEGYFSIEDGMQILKTAKSLGLKTKIHADELVGTGAAELAAKLGSLSADHLLKISDVGIKKLARSNTVAVLLPGTAFYLKASHAPARKLIDAGAAVAISTDFNPGTSMCLSLPAIMTIAALYLGMSRSELFASVTYNGAKALGLEARKGTIEPGMDADFVVLPFARFEELYYRFAWAPLK